MASPAFAGTLIENYGHFSVFWTPWTVDVSSEGMTLGVKLQGMSSTEPISGWKPHPGWFVYVERPATWAYDGNGLIAAQVVTPEKVITYELKLRDTWGALPNPPKEVFDRLPTNIQTLIRKKFPEPR